MPRLVKVKARRAWTETEDEELKKIYNKKFSISWDPWTEIAKSFNADKPEDAHRIAKTCRERFEQHLAPGLCEKKFTPEQKQLIISLRENAYKYHEIQKELLIKYGLNFATGRIKNSYRSKADNSALKVSSKRKAIQAKSEDDDIELKRAFSTKNVDNNDPMESPSLIKSGTKITSNGNAAKKRSDKFVTRDFYTTYNKNNKNTFFQNPLPVTTLIPVPIPDVQVKTTNNKSTNTKTNKKENTPFSGELEDLFPGIKAYKA